MRKFGRAVLALALVLCLVLAAAGCGSSGDGDKNQSGGGTARDYILIGVPNPKTGALASFGEASPWAEELAVKAINDQGGIYIKSLNKKLPIKLKFYDTESNQTKASEMAQKLILEDKVDMLVVRHTPDTVNPVSAIAERYEIPCVAADCCTDAWLEGGPYKWTFHSFWKIENIYPLFIDMWKQAGLTNAKVGFMFPQDPDGLAWAKAFSENLPKDGYEFVDPGRYAQLTQDYSTIINQFKQQNVQIVVGCDIAPDFSTFWKQCQQFGYKPKVVTVGKAYLFESDALSLGADLANGLMTENWWSPYHPFKSSIDGMTCQELCDKYTAETGRVWNATLGFKYGSMEVAIDALKRAESLDKNDLREAIKATDLPTIMGHIKYDEDNWSPTPVVGAQWVKDGDDIKLEIVNNYKHPEIPVTAELIPLGGK